jgi:hypothetical protein
MPMNSMKTKQLMNMVKTKKIMNRNTNTNNTIINKYEHN